MIGPAAFVGLQLDHARSSAGGMELHPLELIHNTDEVEVHPRRQETLHRHVGTGRHIGLRGPCH